jgi:hypothetical protein
LKALIRLPSSLKIAGDLETTKYTFAILPSLPAGISFSKTILAEPISVRFSSLTFSHSKIHDAGKRVFLF